MIPNGESCASAVALLKFSNHAMTNPALMALQNTSNAFTAENPRLLLNMNEMRAISDYIVDLVVFGKNANQNKSDVLEQLCPMFASRKYILHEDNQPNGEDGTLSYCHQAAAQPRAFHPDGFQVSPPTPGYENICTGQHLLPMVTAGNSDDESKWEPPPKKPKEDVPEQGADGSENPDGGDQSDEDLDPDDDPNGVSGQNDNEESEQGNECFLSYMGQTKSKTHEGNLKQLSTLAEQQPFSGELGVSGVQNMADLILSRTGIYDWELRDLSTTFVCEKHERELGLYGRSLEKSFPQVKLKRGQRQPQCNIPNIDGMTYHSHAVAAAYGRHNPSVVSKEESMALLKKKHTFVPVGTGNSTIIIVTLELFMPVLLLLRTVHFS